MDHAKKPGDVNGGIVGPRMIPVDDQNQRKQEEQDDGFAREGSESRADKTNGV
ncbi:MAG TPA: hypothetical protein VHX13_12670 [Acidobacteriaceae bacterium]|jgi:hypothetical protein|nr:hypothetical protein [Acidobacteriaceae bacterium]